MRGGVWLSCLVVAWHGVALARGGSVEGVCAVRARMQSRVRNAQCAWRVWHSPCEVQRVRQSRALNA